MDIKPWQEKLVNDIMQGRELKLMMSGRNVGKSYWTNQAINRLMKDLMNRPVEELVLAERLYRTARFYTVEPIGGNWLDMEVWCLKTFGPSDDVWDFKTCNVGRWYANDRKFWFRNEQDRTLFILKWSV
jgi:hypothetical protein